LYLFFPLLFPLFPLFKTLTLSACLRSQFLVEKIKEFDTKTEEWHTAYAWTSKSILAYLLFFFLPWIKAAAHSCFFYLGTAQTKLFKQIFMSS
jgi:hypothetical protein